MKALLIVDLQNDFLPGGSLSVRGGKEIIAPINRLVDCSFFDLVVASKDWHPLGHVSFASSHGKNPGERQIVAGLEQSLWPDHCVQSSEGANFPPEFYEEGVELVFYKGIDLQIDSYSAFYDNARQRGTGLASLLIEKGVKELFVAGLATDYCVKFTVLDSLKEGFKTFVVVDCCRAVNLVPGDEEQALEQMMKEGAKMITSGDLLSVVSKKKE